MKRWPVYLLVIARHCIGNSNDLYGRIGDRTRLRGTFQTKVELCLILNLTLTSLCGVRHIAHATICDNPAEISTCPSWRSSPRDRRVIERFSSVFKQPKVLLLLRVLSQWMSSRKLLRFFQLSRLQTSPDLVNHLKPLYRPTAFLPPRHQMEVGCVVRSKRNATLFIATTWKATHCNN